MSSSGVTNFNRTGLQIVTSVLGKLNIIGAGETPSSDDAAKVIENLNLVVKQWVSQVDFAPGLKMWTRRRAFLFLQKDQFKYSVGPTGDECASEDYVSTTLAANAAAAAGTVTLTSVTGIATTYRIGIVLNSGSMQWTTVNGAPAGQVVTLTDTLTGAASAGNAVYVYVTKPLRPFEIVSASLRDQAGYDMPMDPNLSVDEYELIPAKGNTGAPARIYFEAKKTNATLYLDRAPDDLGSVIRLVYLSYIEDLNAVGEDVDFPPEWYRALIAQTAIDSAPDFGRPVTPELKLMRDESLRMAQNAYPQKSTAFYQSKPDCY